MTQERLQKLLLEILAEGVKSEAAYDLDNEGLSGCTLLEGAQSLEVLTWVEGEENKGEEEAWDVQVIVTKL